MRVVRDREVAPDAESNVHAALALLAEVAPRRQRRLRHEVSVVSIRAWRARRPNRIIGWFGGGRRFLIDARTARDWPVEALAILMVVELSRFRLRRAVPLARRRSADVQAQCARRARIEALDVAARLPAATWAPGWVHRWLGHTRMASRYAVVAGAVRIFREAGLPRWSRRALICAVEAIRSTAR